MWNAAIFLIENTPREQFEQIVEQLADFITDESARAIGLLAVWMKQLYKNERIDKTMLDEVYSLKNAKEGKSMIVETIKELKKDWFEEGIEKGIEKGRKEGREEGLEEGLEKGIEKGRQEGREEGREEGIEKGRLDTARRMKAKGYPVADIVEITGLSKEVIASL